MAQLKAGTTIGGKLAETVEGAQAKIDMHEAKAAPHSGHETPSGAQAKADAALNSAKAYTDQRVNNKADSIATVSGKKAGYAVYAP